jgi:cytochrome c oxidase assembly protein subunit 15
VYGHEVNKDLIIQNKLLLTLFILIFFQILYGAFVSGTDSGLLYNTWPFYNGNVAPGDLIIQNRYFYSFFENKEFILFFHRTFAFILLFIIIYLNYVILNKDSKYETLILIISFDIVFLIQGGIGVLMTVLNIPWYLALAHQGNSIILFLLSIYMCVLSRKSS